MGVAKLSFGGCCLPGIASGGSADGCDNGGAAALLMGRWLGEAGMAKPSLGTLFPDCDRFPPGTGGRRRGAGEACMLARFGGLRERCGGRATTGKVHPDGGCRRGKTRPSRQPACCSRGVFAALLYGRWWDSGLSQAASALWSSAGPNAAPV